ncbi:MAG: [FeFe] hydrogenase H-cluster maturation GTPase HydF [Lachnobacterium sp.]|mgnify:FL=1|nr:[FeFe] hydrogenase H-cluster maturation GTPase HydF [Lachnobacterium sp.]MDY5460992.1 [FeFe] hydrogenase H-cluster maturation GTPase HydF [Agathobacter sp.]
MGTTLNDTPSANRLHIGVFGKTNSGKSTLINAFTGQEVSIASDIAGTTTDPVYKAMEIHPLGACTIIDTAGFDDASELGAKRVEKTKLAAEKTDVAVIVFAADGIDKKEEVDQLQETDSKTMEKHFAQELKWYHFFKEKNTPVLLIINKADLGDAKALQEFLVKETNEHPLVVSAAKNEGIDRIKEALARKVPENFGERLITGTLVGEEDLVMLVMPQDIQAPKGRLILPQVQTTRELLDKKCLIMSVTTDKFVAAVKQLVQPPKLIITDSQVFSYVYENKPKESMLTSFSVLFAAYKGDLPYYVEGAKQIDSLTEQSRVLIAECCTHAPLQEDIGRVKIPRMLKKRFGEGITVDHVSGTDFPQDLRGYDLIIQCGACMFNRKYVLSRIDHAKEQQVPMTNYGVTIAHLTGILPHVVMP